MIEEKPLLFLNSECLPNIKLYHYFGNMKYALDAIENDTVYCGLSFRLNDIFDGYIVNNGIRIDSLVPGEPRFIIAVVNDILYKCPALFFDFCGKNSSLNEIEKSFLEENTKEQITPTDYLRFIYKHLKIEDEFQNFIQVIKDEYIKKSPIEPLSSRIACFSEVNDSILMWSYYADCHKGICLEYDPTLLLGGNEQDKLLYKALKKVRYSQKQYNNSSLFFCENDLYNVFYNKAFCWAHEQEWRFALLNYNIEKITFNCLTGIYLGARFRETYHNDEVFGKILDNVYSRKRKIGLYEAKPNRFEYKIDFDTIIAKEK